MEVQKQLVGIVIRQDGTVPFDDECSGEVRGAILSHLTDLGHTYEPVHGTRHVRIKDWQPNKTS